MKINSNDFRVRAGAKVDLADWPTRIKPIYKSHKKYHTHLKHHVKALSKLQRLHYASGRSALLLIFQGMDAAGGDGAIRHIASGINP
jgi:polyphosphate kinase 2 (PPK2 family)